MSSSLHQSCGPAGTFSPAPQATPLITVAICTLNRADSLRAAIGSVLEQCDDQIEILVIDNGSTDGTSDLVQNLILKDSRIRYCHEASPGIANARNRALKEGRAPIILFFDDDERPRPGWLEAYLSFFRSSASPRVGCVGGPYRAVHLTRAPRWMNAKFGSVQLGKKPGLLTEKLTLPGGNCAYVKAIALAIGGFDPTLARYEDADLNLRMRAKGYEVWWLPEAEVDHLLDASRFRFKRHIIEKFAEGRSVARLRIKACGTPGRKFAHALGRVLGSPLLMVIQGMGALFCWCLFRVRVAAKLALKSCRSAGIAAESLALLLTFWRIPV